MSFKAKGIIQDESERAISRKDYEISGGGRHGKHVTIPRINFNYSINHRDNRQKEQIQCESTDS
jgi:hypothetical protein